MTIDRLINVLVLILLVEMMVAIGLGLTTVELIGVARNWHLLVRAALANYVCFPAITVGLLLWFHPLDPTVSAGFLILAVCPGAPFGPPCTRIAGGDTAAAVGMMAFLAGSSAIAAPLLLAVLLPLVSGEAALHVDAAGIIGTLLVTQLLPLCLGLLLRRFHPKLAESLQRPANLLSAVLSVLTFGLILCVQFPVLARIHLRGYGGMLMLLVASLAVGWLCGGDGTGIRRAMALTTALRNLGVGLVIATSNFANTGAQTAVLAYGIVEIAGSVLLAWIWGRNAVDASPG